MGLTLRPPRARRKGREARLRGFSSSSNTADSLAERSFSANGRGRDRSRRTGGARQPEGERAAPAEGALHGDVPPLELRQQARDGETDTGAAQRPAPRLIDAEKAIEDS